MTPGGWIIMALAVGGMTGLLAWCVYRVLSHPGSTQKMHSRADIDTHDHE